MKKRHQKDAQQKSETRKIAGTTTKKAIKIAAEQAARSARRKLNYRNIQKSKVSSFKQKLASEVSQLKEEEAAVVYETFVALVSKAKNEITKLSTKPPIPMLSEKQISEIGIICKKWDVEKNQYRGRVFDWVEQELAPYIPGLMQSHLRVNMNLYRNFAKGIERNGLPSDLDVPNEPDAILRNEQDPVRRAALIEARCLSSLNMQIRRQLHI